MRYAMGTTNGSVETLHVHDDAIAIQRTVDVQPVVDAVRIEAATTGGWSPTRELRHIGEIPEGILQAHAQRRGIANYMDLLKPGYRKELLSIITDPDFRLFSPSGGAV